MIEHFGIKINAQDLNLNYLNLNVANPFVSLTIWGSSHHLSLKLEEYK